MPYGVGQFFTPDGRFLVFYSEATDLDIQQVAPLDPNLTVSQVHAVRNPFLPLQDN